MSSNSQPVAVSRDPSELIPARAVVAEFLGISIDSLLTERGIEGYPGLVSVSAADLDHASKTMTLRSFIVEAATGVVHPLGDEELHDAAGRISGMVQQ